MYSGGVMANIGGFIGKGKINEFFGRLFTLGAFLKPPNTLGANGYQCTPNTKQYSNDSVEEIFNQITSSVDGKPSTPKHIEELIRKKVTDYNNQCKDQRNYDENIQDLMIQELSPNIKELINDFNYCKDGKNRWVWGKECYSDSDGGRSTQPVTQSRINKITKLQDALKLLHENHQYPIPSYVLDTDLNGVKALHDENKRYIGGSKRSSTSSAQRAA
jgi:hypothetical protein